VCTICTWTIYFKSMITKITKIKYLHMYICTVVLKSILCLYLILIWIFYYYCVQDWVINTLMKFKWQNAVNVKDSKNINVKVSKYLHLYDHHGGSIQTVKVYLLSYCCNTFPCHNIHICNWSCTFACENRHVN
jgi:hypothetical protein